MSNNRELSEFADYLTVDDTTKNVGIGTTLKISAGGIFVGNTEIVRPDGTWGGPDTGLVGAQGAQGFQGAVGAQGAQGAVGAQGATGAQGSAGAQGATGAQGSAGAQGAVGAQGSTGAQGAVGAQGAQGATGAQGAQGATGPVGGSNTQILFNDGGSTGGDAGLTFNKTTNVVSVGDQHRFNVGTFTEPQRDALTSTSDGTIIVNTTAKALEVYGPDGWKHITTLETTGVVGATGGTLVSPNPGGYELRHFPAGPSSFSFSSAGAASYIHVLLVAGGGAGGFGGGGGGGVAYAYNLPIPATGATYPISVGAGGDNRANGGDSLFTGHPVGTITAKGGGGNIPPEGPNNNQRQGAPGGSGGGAGHTGPVSPTGGTATQASQNPGVSWPEGSLYQYGQPGGNNPTPSACCAGGGGGGAYGPSPLTSALPVTFRETGTYRSNNSTLTSPPDSTGGGPGGNGITFGWIPTSLGDTGYFSGGGGGAYGPPGGGGQGGGGAGAPSGTVGVDGTGGGGGSYNGSSLSGGNGIVLVYYLAA
jgi:hypothetical protein